MLFRVFLSASLLFLLGAAPASSQEDDLVPLPKLAPREDGLRVSPRGMHDLCLDKEMTDPNRIHFTPAEYGAAMLALGKQIAELIQSSTAMTGADAAQAAQARDQLFAQLDTLATCQLEEYAYTLRFRAAASCRGLRNAVELLDGPAVTALKREKIIRGDWLRMLESFLPAAAKCRRSLGQCLNPNNARQMQDYRYLLEFVVDVEMVSKGETTVSYVLPPCNQTMIEQGKDKVPDDPLLEFVEKAPEVIPVTVEYDQPPVILPVTIEWGAP